MGTATDGAPSERLIIRTPRGFLLEAPATNDFRLLCNEALGVADNEAAAIGDVGDKPDNALLLATWANGLLRGSADGCTWTPVGSGVTAPAFDIAVARSSSGARAYVVGGVAHEGEHLWSGQDGGTRWSALANTDFPYTRVRVAPGNPSRVYLSGIGLTATGTIFHRLGVSDDAGLTVVDRLITLGPHDFQARLLGVDPVRPDRLFVLAESNTAEAPETLLVSQDAGQSFTPAATLLEIHGFAQSETGTSVWVGGKEGILRSVDGGQTFAPLTNPAMTEVTCLASHKGQLYACGVLANRLVVAVSEDGGDTFREAFSFDRVKQAIDCPQLDPARAPASVCAAALNHWRSELGAPDAPAGTPSVGTGGSPAASPDAGSGTPSVDPGASGCNLGVARASSTRATLVAAILMALAVGRRGRPSCRRLAARAPARR